MTGVEAPSGSKERPGDRARLNTTVVVHVNREHLFDISKKETQADKQMEYMGGGIKLTRNY